MAGGRTVARLVMIAVAGLICGIVLQAAHAQKKGNDAAALNADVKRLYREGKYAEATQIVIRLLANLEKTLGPEHPQVATSLNDLAELYRAQGRYSEAEPLYRRSLAIREKALGPEHLDVGQQLNNLALLYWVQGRYAEAARLFQRSLTIHEKVLGPEHPDVGTALNNLALMYQNEGRYADAEPLYKRSLAIREKAFGPEHQEVGNSLNNLASLYQNEGRYADAEPLQKRGLAIQEKVLGPEHPDVAMLLNNLAELYQNEGRYADAEPLYKRSLAIYEKTLGSEHPNLAQLLNNLAALLGRQQRYEEAEPLYKRSLAIREQALGPEHPDVGNSLNNLAWLYHSEGRYADAEPLYKRSLAIYEKALGLEHPNVAMLLNNLAELYRAQGRYAEAQSLNKRSLAIQENALGPEHPDVAMLLNNLALMYQDEGRYAEAEPLYKRGLAIQQKALGPVHPEVAMLLSNMALLALVQNDWASAAEYWRRSTNILRQRAERGLVGGRGVTLGGEAQRQSLHFWGLVKATHRLVAQGHGPMETLAVEMFETAQWVQGSEVATSLAQMAARSALGSPQLGRLVRERQDLVSEWQSKDKQLIAAKSEPPTMRRADAEKTLADRLVAIDALLAEIDRQLAQEFPDYSALASSVPVSIEEIQSQLGPDEALVLFLDTPDLKPTPEETFIWVVTKSALRWVRSAIGTETLAQRVMALRCGLDATAWDGGGAEKCAKSLVVPLDKLPSRNQPLPFDHASAYELYSLLLGEVQDLIKGKHLLIIPSGPLTQLPFQVLVTHPPTSGDHRPTAWLARAHAITVLPAASSLKALRRVGRPSGAPRPMIGFGNPLLDGPDWRYAANAKLAREKQRCPESGSEQIAALAGPSGGVLHVETRGGLADVAHIKMQVPLPETADELCAVARDMKTDARDIWLGTRATEREIKQLSASGELARYRMVHFATHGVLAGQLDGTHEPGLILTPPDKATEEDDGYLSASEIAALKLDADWVILSACNTAAGDATSAEALSGLARAFIYAQARALLVSHWEVYSDATVKLITTAVREMASDPKVGRAEAMRRSMLSLIDKGAAHESHPAYWAPFVVVGEGAAVR